MATVSQLAAAEALVLAFRYDEVNVLTARPALYDALGDEPPIIPA